MMARRLDPISCAHCRKMFKPATRAAKFCSNPCHFAHARGKDVPPGRVARIIAGLAEYRRLTGPFDDAQLDMYRAFRAQRYSVAESVDMVLRVSLIA